MTGFGIIVHTALGAAADVTAHVGTSPVRIYPNVLPENCSFPAIAYQVSSDQPLNSLGGFTSGTRNAQVQVDVYARTYLDVQDLADAVEAVFAGLLSPSLSSTQGSRRDLREDAVELHRVSMDFSLWRTQ